MTEADLELPEGLVMKRYLWWANVISCILFIIICISAAIVLLSGVDAYAQWDAVLFSIPALAIQLVTSVIPALLSLVVSKEKPKQLCLIALAVFASSATLAGIIALLPHRGGSC